MPRQSARMQREEPSPTTPVGDELWTSIFQGYADYIDSLFQGATVAGRSICDFFGLPCSEISASLATALAIPLAVCRFIWWLLSCLAYVIRRFTRSDPLQFFLYTAIPWVGALIYSLLSIFVPQLDLFKKIFYLLFHPIQFFLDLFAKVDQRAERVRDMVDVLGPQTGQRRPKPSRLMCYRCQRREKTCLLTPCNHFCLCEPCYDEMVSRGRPECPQCQRSVDSFIRIEL